MVVCISLITNIYVSQSFFPLSFITQNTTLILPLPMHATLLVIPLSFINQLY